MNISHNWLKDHIDIDKAPEELSLILTDIGLEVESLEKVQGIPGGLEGLLVGEVRACERHPNADKLNLTAVDIGRPELLRIVCGAPNVRTGLKVVVAPVGAVCHPIEGEPFKITKSKIRGEVSEGMLCSASEIGLGSSHAGLLELDQEAVVGTLVKDHFRIEDDYRYEIGLTPNRADAASHLGVARDLAAYFRKELKLTETAGFQEDKTARTNVRVLDASAAPRYSGIDIAGVTVAESPDWLKERLQTIGVRPINNIVDITNYILHDLGQPLHAFDADKIAGSEVRVRRAEEGEPFVTLDGVERRLSAEDLVIADAEKPMCMAGVFGGERSGVTEATRSIFLESAYFDPVSVRKTAKRHGLKTDSSFRFERGTDPDMTVYALKKAVSLIREIAGGEVSSALTDMYPEPVLPFAFTVDCQNLRRLIGQDIPQGEIRAIIEALGITVSGENGTELAVQVPPYRVDVTREVDVVEEVLRMYGYNNIALKPQLKTSLEAQEKPDKEIVVNQVADMLVANGFREILNNSLTKAAFVDDLETAVRLVNPLSSDLDTMRQNLLFSALTALSHNQKRKQPDARYFEFGKTYFKTAEGYRESQRLAICLSGDAVSEQWNTARRPVDFYRLKAAVDVVVKRLNIRDLQTAEANGTCFAYGLSYLRGQKTLVSFGSVAPDNLKKTDVDGRVFYAEFDWDLLLKAIRKNTVRYREVPKFPSVRRDLALLLDESVTFDRLKTLAFRSERKLLKAVGIFDVYKGKGLPEGKKSYALSFVLQDEEKTLNDKQIDAIVQKLMLTFEKETGATLRR